MPPHCCNYCLKAIATEAGIKHHIAQSPACHNQWTKLLEQIKFFTVSNDEDGQHPEQVDDGALGNPYRWTNESDAMDGPDNALDVPDGHLVHPSCIDVDSGPPELCKPPSKRARVEDDNGDSPPWPASGHFTEQYPGVAAAVLGRKKTVFKSLEAAELEKGENEWAPFRDEDEWELAGFLMRNLGQTKINEMLKLSLVSE